MFASSEAPIFERARELRNSPTHCEEILCQHLRQKPCGYKFRRQHPFFCFILDFYCHKLHFVIEVDGKIHEQEEVRQNDEEREAILKQHGLQVIRFTNDEVLTHLNDVVLRIDQLLRPREELKQESSFKPKSPL